MIRGDSFLFYSIDPQYFSSLCSWLFHQWMTLSEQWFLSLQWCFHLSCPILSYRRVIYLPLSLDERLSHHVMQTRKASGNGNPLCTYQGAFTIPKSSPWLEMVIYYWMHRCIQSLQNPLQRQYLIEVHLTSSKLCQSQSVYRPVLSDNPIRVRRVWCLPEMHKRRCNHWPQFGCSLKLLVRRYLRMSLESLKINLEQFFG